MIKKVAVFAVVYPMDEIFLLDFFTSLNSQTYKNFDLVLVNDNLESLERLLSQFPKLKVITLPFSGTPLDNRRYGIEYIQKSDYDAVVFADSDDYFSSNRVRVALEKLLNYDVVVNDITVFGNEISRVEKYFSNRIKNNSEIFLHDIQDKNIFGMSNTSLKVEYIDGIIYDDDVIAFDWYLFSMVLVGGGRALFTNECETFYRQHGNNLIGMRGCEPGALVRMLAVKQKQYELLSRADARYKVLLKQVRRTSVRVSKGELSEADLMVSTEYPFWWENIRLSEERL